MEFIKKHAECVYKRGLEFVLKMAVKTMLTIEEFERTVLWRFEKNFNECLMESFFIRFIKLMFMGSFFNKTFKP